MEVSQRQLGPQQLEAFYQDGHASEQVERFVIFDNAVAFNRSKKVLDVGGGCGHFASQLQRVTGMRARVMDTDAKSIEQCQRAGIEASVGDALAPQSEGNEGVVCFNLILHHLIGDDEATTRGLQKQALLAWRGKSDYLLVNEYVYNSFFHHDLSGRIIFAVTSSKFFSALGRFIGRFVPSLRANTFGVGVRFRSEASWLALFKECGFTVEKIIHGRTDHTQLARRVLLIKRKQRDSFLLRA